MDEKTSMTKFRIAAMVFIWFCILGIGALAYRYWFHPRQQQAAEQQAKQEHKATIEKTSAPSRFKYSVNFAADTFSGYAVIRFVMKVQILEARSS